MDAYDKDQDGRLSLDEYLGRQIFFITPETRKLYQARVARLRHTLAFNVYLM